MTACHKWGPWLLLALAALPWTAGPARGQAVEPLIAADQMLSVDQVRPGMKGVGRSVFSGTKIEPFGVTVIGVLRKIDFGGDMILIRIDDGPPVTSGAGVSSGMSGSPIYVEGKLIGALAFAWPFAKQPVAGVTPIAQMLENYRPGSVPAPAVAQAGDLRVEGPPLQLDGRVFTRATVVPERGQAVAGGPALYLHPVATPVLVSGMGRQGVELLGRRFKRHPVFFAQGPGQVDLPPGERPRLEPGAAVGVQLLGGDIDATAIGTVTYVKGPHVIAFGHPMFGLGTLDMPLTTAYIHGVIPTQEVSFKLGAPVETVGRLSQDRNWSIGGELGAVPRSVAGEFAVSDLDRGVRRNYRITSAVHRDLTPTLLYSALLSAVQSVAPPESGTTRGSVEVWARGLAPIKRENVYSTAERRSQIEVLFGDPFAGLPLVELLQILDALENNSFGAVPVERIRVAVEVTDKRRTATIERAYADRKRVKPGDTVKIGVVLRPADGPRETRQFDLEIPANIPGGRMQIGVAAGGAADRVRQIMAITRPPARSLAQLVGVIVDREANNELVIEAAQPVMGVATSGREFPNLPNVVVEVLTSASATGIRMVRSHSRRVEATPWVLSGAQLISLQVEADEKDKSGMAFAPGQGGYPGFSSLLDLFRFGFGGDLGPDFGGDFGDVGEGGEEFARRRLLDRLLAAPNLPLDPRTPSFEELRRLLEGEGGGSLPEGTGGGEVTAPRKSVGRGPGVWRIAAARDFQGGKLEGVLVSSRGELGLAPRAEPVLSSPDRLYWAQASDAKGNVYAAGWLDGSIMKIGPDGKATPFFDRDDEVAVTALAVDTDGSVLAAAEPSGTLYRISPDGRGTAFARVPGRRVWSLCPAGSSVYAGTGSDGRVLRVAADGRVEEVFAAPDRHVIALAQRGETVYCATYPRGKIFRLRAGKAEPVYELPSLTATALALDEAGNLYVGTSPRATVVRITPAGDAATLFTGKEKHVFALAAEPGGAVLVGAGPQARVYRVQPDRTVSTLWEPQAAYVLALTRDADGRVFATTAGPSQLVRLTPQPEGQGTFTSAVLNAGNVARWGVVRWSAAGGVTVRTRSGNTAYPDSTWSGWTEPYAAATGQPIASPQGQYLQYRVDLKGGKEVPVLRSLELFYRARNRAPELTLRAPAPGDALAGTRAIRWRGKDPDGDRLTYDVFYARENSDRWVKIGTKTAADLDEEGGDAIAEEEPEGPGRAAMALPARAAAARRSGGRLAAAAVGPRRPAPAGVGARRPVQYGPGVPEGGAPDMPEGAMGERAEGVDDPDLEEALGSGGSITWNTKRIPDGRYRVKVVASDHLTSPDEAQAAEVVSEVFRIDNSPPQILIKAAKRTWPVPPLEIPAKETTSYIASAEYRVDEGPWIAAAAGDGIFDSPEEVIRIDPARLPVGRHTLAIRARDAGGNEATVTTPYVLKQSLAPPAGAAPAPPVAPPVAPPARPQQPPSRP